MKLMILVVLLMSVPSQLLGAENLQVVDVQTDDKRVSLYASPEYFVLKQNEVVISGLSISAGFIYALNDNWAVVPGIQQAYSPDDDYATLFTNLNFGAVWAITGKLNRSDRVLTADGWPVVKSINDPTGGFRFLFKGTQYFLNTKSAAIPYSGAGVGIYYEFPSAESISFSLGLDADRVSNGDAVMIVPHAFSRVHFYM
jgi:hypothetical protein